MLDNEVNCPYCTKVVEIDEYEHEGKLFRQRCPECKKIFVYNVEITYIFSVFKADCANNLHSLHSYEHNFIPIHRFPKTNIIMECTICGEERDPTKHEMDQLISMKPGYYFGRLKDL